MMRIEKRWRVRRSVRWHDRWLAYQTIGGRKRGPVLSFRSWDSAMDYANSKARWHRR